MYSCVQAQVLAVTERLVSVLVAGSRDFLEGYEWATRVFWLHLAHHCAIRCVLVGDYISLIYLAQTSRKQCFDVPERRFRGPSSSTRSAFRGWWTIKTIPSSQKTSVDLSYLSNQERIGALYIEKERV
jgi:hypothetical protein